MNVYQGLRRQVVARGFALLILVAYAQAARTQPIANPSFEHGGKFSIDGWMSTWTGPNRDLGIDPYNDAPEGGGEWSVKLPVVNIQGGPLIQLYQLLANVVSGDIMRATVWAKVPDNSATPARLFFTDFSSIVTYPSDSAYVILPTTNVDTTTAGEWTQLIVIDTLLFVPGDSLAIVIDAGFHGGATFDWDYAVLDLVTVERIGRVPTGTEKPSETGETILFRPAPNPIRGIATLTFNLTRPSSVTLTVMDMLGRHIRTLLETHRPPGQHQVAFDASGLASGTYLICIEASSLRECTPASVIR